MLYSFTYQDRLNLSSDALLERIQPILEQQAQAQGWQGSYGFEVSVIFRPSKDVVEYLVEVFEE